jgi:hypothetical protein
MVRGPLRNELPASPGASTTASPVPAQPSRAAWIRLVSGGLASSVLLNSPVVVDSVACSVTQVCGTLGSFPTNLVVIEGHKRLTGLLVCPHWLPAELHVMLGITASHHK